MLITLLLHGAGFRESEPFHLYISDVFPDPSNPSQAKVLIHHPSHGGAPADWRDEKGKPRKGNRAVGALRPGRRGGRRGSREHRLVRLRLLASEMEVAAVGALVPAGDGTVAVEARRIGEPAGRRRGHRRISARFSGRYA